MDQGISIETMVLLIGFAVLVASAAWHRTRLDAEIEALPRALRDRLGWEPPGDASLKRRRRRIADRLVLRGLPPWVPLPGPGRRHLMWLRLLGAGFGPFHHRGAPLVAGVWGLLAILGPPVMLILALRCWLVGPWEGS